VDWDAHVQRQLDDRVVEGHLVEVAVAAAVVLEPLQAVAGLEVDEAVFGTEPVHADLAGDAAVFCADDALGTAFVQQLPSDIVHPDGLLELGDEAVVLAGEDFLRLGGKPVGIGLGGLAKGFASLGVDGAVADEILLVERHAAFQDEAVGGASQCQRGTLGRRDFTGHFAVIQRWGFAEVGKQMARHVAAVSALGVVLFRRNG